jgi:hypothetical protein
MDLNLSGAMDVVKVFLYLEVLFVGHPISA